MAAPISSYRPEKLKQGNAIANYVAIPLTDYLISGKGEFESVKQWFHLDGRLVVVANGQSGFIGYVYSDSYNARLHKSTRTSSVRVMINNRAAYLLNDAGLNTMCEITASVVRKWANYVKVNVVSRSAYYDSTTARKLEFVYKPNGALVKRDVGAGFLARKATANEMVIFNPERLMGETMNIPIYSINPEGEYRITLPNVSLGMRIAYYEAQVVDGYQNPEPSRHFTAWLFERDYLWLIAQPNGNIMSPYGTRIYDEDSLTNVVANSWVLLNEYVYRTDSHSGFVMEKRAATYIAPGIYIETRLELYAYGIYRWKYYATYSNFTSAQQIQRAVSLKPLLRNLMQETTEYDETKILAFTTGVNTVSDWGEIEISGFSAEFLQLQLYASGAVLKSSNPSLPTGTQIHTSSNQIPYNF